ncbi:MAG: hypothetical protein CMA64_11660 [Euryarchaeota archaeon]|nr:hypothetical protein [Euryarchaeota archaeon]|tara:strand:+ start:35 stop:469 length:435 start_codon:yes stop_codon:yes gene_type:complete
MAKQFAQGKYSLKNPTKYVGRRTPTYRSSWEFAFMKFCDENPAIQAWASEAVKIPFRNPFTGRHTIYVPDFFIQYKTRKGKNKVELIEVKPDNQTFKESATSKHNKAHWVLNQAKWEAAGKYAKSKGIGFRVITEKDMFHQGRR